MVTVPVSPYCELGRWTLERLGVAYTEEGHAPTFHRRATKRNGGGATVPVLNTGKTSLADARQIVEHYEQRAPEALRLYPADAARRAEAKQLFDECFDVLGVGVRAWAYAYLLPERRSTVRAWTDGVPALERRLVPFVFPILRVLVRRTLKLGPDTIVAERERMNVTLDRLGARLADGRRYLLGDRLTAPDLALATLLAPAVLPPEYSGPLPTFDELPAPMRREVDEIREHPAGRLALRLFAEERRPAS